MAFSSSKQNIFHLFENTYQDKLDSIAVKMLADNPNLPIAFFNSESFRDLFDFLVELPPKVTVSKPSTYRVKSYVTQDIPLARIN